MLCDISPPRKSIKKRNLRRFQFVGADVDIIALMHYKNTIVSAT